MKTMQSTSTSSPTARLTTLLQKATLLTIILALSGAAAYAERTMTRGKPRGTPVNPRTLTVMDQNLFVGAEFTPILSLDPNDPAFPFQLPLAVTQVYSHIVVSDFPSRAAALADQIDLVKPELIALQEVALIRVQTPGDMFLGGTTPATEVEMDYLAILLAALHERGLYYTAAVAVENLDIELPMPALEEAFETTDVRLTDRDVILVRADLPPGQLRVSNPKAGNYQTALSLGEEWDLSIKRGWCSVDVRTRNRNLRFINTHLEENTAPPVQYAQAQELLAGPANTTLPVIMAGDFNSDANGEDQTETYDLLTDSFQDAWMYAFRFDEGLTWGHDPLLADPEVEFVWRLDLMLFRGRTLQVLGMYTVDPLFRETPPLWPSDHAGLVTRFWVK